MLSHTVPILFSTKKFFNPILFFVYPIYSKDEFTFKFFGANVYREIEHPIRNTFLGIITKINEKNLYVACPKCFFRVQNILNFQLNERRLDYS